MFALGFLRFSALGFWGSTYNKSPGLLFVDLVRGFTAPLCVCVCVCLCSCMSVCVLVYFFRPFY